MTAEPTGSDIKAQRAALFADPLLHGYDFCRAYTAVADGWLSSLFAAGDPGDDVALVAVGGYGRGDLCPGSDLDVMLVHQRSPRDIDELAGSLWYPLWDAGIKVGHATRTVDEALALALGDLDTATALLEARAIAGDPAVASELSERARDQWREGADRWMPLVAAATESRHRRSGELAFLLEPDLKEARGGLRDTHTVAWIDAAREVLLDSEREAMAECRQVLLAARVELHRRSGKSTDVLLLQDQDSVAEGLGYADADALMAHLAGVARTVAWTVDETRARLRSHRSRPAPKAVPMEWTAGPGLAWRDGALELTADADPASDPTLVLRAAAMAAEAGARLSRAALDRLAAEAQAPGDPWPEEVREELVELLLAGRGAIPVLESLDQVGLLVALIPEWQAVRSRPQRNAYHRFTVDRHLCEAAAGAAELTGRVHRPDLLLVGTLLHDIGKGYVPEIASDHSEAGVEVVRRVATRMGFPTEDVKVLETLVRHHLLLADAATRRDIDDPATIEAVAAAVGQRETLHLLHALTEADSMATGPAAWSAWKSQLVTGLVNRVERELAGEEAEPTDRFPGPMHADARVRARDHDEITVDGRDRWVTIVAPDRPGLFSRVAGTLTLHGLDVLTARAWAGDDGTAVEELRVEPVFGGDPGWDKFESDLDLVLRGRLSLEARVAERARRYERRNRAMAAETARTSVMVDDSASAQATVVEVRAPDRIGTLYRITRALAELHLDIRHAKVSTLGHEVVDAFYVVDATGSKLEPEHAAEVERAVLVELARV